MEFNLADLFEAVVDTVPTNEALVLGRAGRAEVRRSYRELDERANRLAHVLTEHGVGAGDNVGLHLHNGHEYVEAMLALFKLRATPVNVNYRYVPEELSYLFSDAELRAVVTEPELAPLVDEARSLAPHDPWARASVLVTGADLERDLAGASPGRPDLGAAGPRRADDLYLLYTGGTTGMPKGVMWRHEDIYFASLGGRGTPSTGVPPLRRPEDVVERARRGDPIRRRLPLCPLMHGGAMWVALQTLLNGGALVLATDRHFDAVEALDLLASERVELTMLIGDATGRPLADALAAEPGRWDLHALQVVASGGAVLSGAVKEALRARLPGTKVVDTFGASETGGQGRLTPGGPGRPPRLVTDADTTVLDDDDRPVVPGSGVMGRLARRGHVPLGYWRDPEKTAATFRMVDGVRWSVPGDIATIESDGSISLFGRGSMCVNTGGEKVFPEEVEAAIKQHPAVFDALVVGLPDPRFGERVVAVVALRPTGDRSGPGDGATPSDAELGEHTRRHVAGYKVPRAWVRVEHCGRLPTGKPDYRWAREIAATGGRLPSG